MLIAVPTERKCKPGHNHSHQQSFVWLALKNTAVQSDESVGRENMFSTSIHSSSVNFSYILFKYHGKLIISRLCQKDFFLPHTCQLLSLILEILGNATPTVYSS